MNLGYPASYTNCVPNWSAIPVGLTNPWLGRRFGTLRFSFLSFMLGPLAMPIPKASASGSSTGDSSSNRGKGIIGGDILLLGWDGFPAVWGRPSTVGAICGATRSGGVYGPLGPREGAEGEKSKFKGAGT